MQPWKSDNIIPTMTVVEKMIAQLKIELLGHFMYVCKNERKVGFLARWAQPLPVTPASF